MKNYRQENKAELMRIKSEKVNARLGSSKPPKTPQQEKRSFIIKAIAFGIALLAAVISFSTFAKQCTNVEAGLQTIDTNTDKEALLYASGIVLNYDLQGTGSEIRAAKMELRNAYSYALAHIYKLLDPVNRYEGYKNLAYINAHPDERVEVSPELMEVLKSAYQLTLEGKANIFGGALYREWYSITILSDSSEFDPIADPDEMERIERLAEATADLNNFTLTLEDSGYACLQISDEYNALLKELESDAPVLDLGYLREAYILQYTAKELEKGGYTKGFLTTVGGMTYCLSEAEGGFIVAYAPSGDAIADAFKVPVSGGLMCCSYRSFAYDSSDLQHYTITDEAGEHLRHPQYSLETGEVSDAVLASFACADKGGFAELCAECYAIASAASAEQAQAVLGSLADGAHAAYILRAQPDRIIKDGGFAGLVPSEGFAL